MLGSASRGRAQAVSELQHSRTPECRSRYTYAPIPKRGFSLPATRMIDRDKGVRELFSESGSLNQALQEWGKGSSLFHEGVHLSSFPETLHVARAPAGPRSSARGKPGAACKRQWFVHPVFCLLLESQDTVIAKGGRHPRVKSECRLPRYEPLFGHKSHLLVIIRSAWRAL